MFTTCWQCERPVAPAGAGPDCRCPQCDAEIDAPIMSPKTLDSQATAQTTRTIPLSELAWCDDHREAAERRGVDPTYAALDFTQRVTDHDLWSAVVTSPADCDLRIGFEDAPLDPPVDMVHTAACEELEYTPLCCVLPQQIRQATYAFAQQPE